MNHTKTPSTPATDWDKLCQEGDSGGMKEAIFEEGGVYRARVVDITWENSRKYPGTKYPRIKFIAFDGHGGSKPVSWIPWEMHEIIPAVTAIDPTARSKPPSALMGNECCVRVSNSRGVVAKQVLPKNYLPGPTLAEQRTLQEQRQSKP